MIITLTLHGVKLLSHLARLDDRSEDFSEERLKEARLSNRMLHEGGDARLEAMFGDYDSQEDEEEEEEYNQDMKIKAWEEGAEEVAKALGAEVGSSPTHNTFNVLELTKHRQSTFNPIGFILNYLIADRGGGYRYPGGHDRGGVHGSTGPDLEGVLEEPEWRRHRGPKGNEHCRHGGGRDDPTVRR